MHRHLFNAFWVFALLLAKASVAQISPSRADEDTTLAHQYFAAAEKLTKGVKRDSANFYFEKASVIYAKAATQNGGRRFWEKFIACYNNIGENLRTKGQTDSALVWLHGALQAGLEKLGDAHLEVAKSYNNIGNVFLTKQDYDQALDHYNRALAIRRQQLGEMHPEVARSYNNIGLAFDYKTDFDKALAAHEKSLAIKLKLLGENSAEVANSYNNMGSVFRNLGDFDKAIAYVKKALLIRQQLFGQYHPRVGDTYINLGIAYDLKDDYEEAIECFQKSLTIFLKAGGENHPGIGGVYNNLGHAYRQTGDLAAALENINKALIFWKKVGGEDHFEVGRAYYNLGRIHLLQGEHDQALANYEKCLALWKPVLGERGPEVAEVYQLFAQVYLTKQDYEQALSYYQKSLIALSFDFSDDDIYRNPTLNNLSSITYVLSSLQYKALALQRRFALRSHDRKDILTALSTYQLASDFIDQMRRSHKDESSKLIWAGKASQIFEQAIQSALQAYGVTKDMQYKAKALFFAEKGKAAVLYQSLQESRARQFAGIPAELLEREKDLRVDLTFYETAVQTEKQKWEKQDLAKLRDFEDRYFKRKLEYERLIKRLEQSYPRYYDLKYRANPASAATLQSGLNDKTAVIEFFAGDSTIFVFTITRAGLDVFATTRDSTFDALVSTLAGSFKNVTSKSVYLISAAQLYHQLIKPIESRIANKPKWVIIPDGELYQIPFEALLTANVPPNLDADYRTLPYLVNQHDISYHYSATLFLQSLRVRPAAYHNDLFAGFAPVFSEQVKNGLLFQFELPEFKAAPPDAHRYLITRDGKTLEELKHSEQELREILAVFFNRGRNYLYQEASEENFKKQTKGSKYVHVATHGFINDENPKLSNLAFSQPRDAGAKEDGILFSGETYNLDLNADLLVLSACQTGAGQIVKGEGLMALTRGFLYSGARNIIASLWKVYDQHTSLLMVEMYRQVAAGKSYSAALREAKLKMITNAETAGPQSWASFVLIGK